MKRCCCRPKRYLLVALALLLLTCGCARGGGEGPLFQDNFDSQDSGWGAVQREEFRRGYRAGKYFFEIYEPHWFTWARPGEKLTDVSVEVDAYLASGSTDNHFGVLCRYVDAENFYYLAISSDGYYAIFLVDSGNLTTLTGDGRGMSSSAAIRTGDQTNRILAICQGSELSLYANGELLETVTDDAHKRGDVALGAGSGSQGDTTIRFDDFVVTEP